MRKRIKIVIREFKLTIEENPVMGNKISLVHKSQTVSDRHTVLLRVKKNTINALIIFNLARYWI